MHLIATFRLRGNASRAQILRALRSTLPNAFNAAFYFATATLDQTQTSAPGSPCPLAPSVPSALQCWSGGHCLVATLPPVVSLAFAALCTPYTTEWVAHPTEFADPPFIPPEDLLCVRSSL